MHVEHLKTWHCCEHNVQVCVNRKNSAVRLHNLRLYFPRCKCDSLRANKHRERQISGTRPKNIFTLIHTHATYTIIIIIDSNETLVFLRGFDKIMKRSLCFSFFFILFRLTTLILKFYFSTKMLEENCVHVCKLEKQMYRKLVTNQ